MVISRWDEFMSRKVLCILSEWGFWGQELGGQPDASDNQGYKVEMLENGVRYCGWRGPDRGGIIRTRAGARP
jgi:hypothetical protein